MASLRECDRCNRTSKSYDRWITVSRQNIHGADKFEFGPIELCESCARLLDQWLKSDVIVKEKSA